jgi:Flp pilus assembly pilin Flp
MTPVYSRAADPPTERWRDASLVLPVTIVRASPLSEAQVRIILLHTYTFGRLDRGQTMAEYAVVLGIITAAILLALGMLTGSISGAIGAASSKI